MGMSGNLQFKFNPQYIAQQEALHRIASELGLIMYYPDYHGKPRDPFTVLFYTKEDAAHNTAVDKEFIRYSRSEASDLMRAWKQTIDDKYIYRDYVWCFQNTDINGLLSLDFANFGTIRLTDSNWHNTVRDAITTALTNKQNGGET